MDAVLVVAIIIGVFFLVGLAVGGVMVITLPVLRGRRPRRAAQREPDDRPVQGDDQLPPDDDPRWPGDDDDGYFRR